MSEPVFSRQVKVPIYHNYVLFGLADTMAETIPIAKRHHLRIDFEDSNDCAGRVSLDTSGRFGIFFERRQLDHRVIAHECFHLP